MTLWVALTGERKAVHANVRQQFMLQKAAPVKAVSGQILEVFAMQPQQTCFKYDVASTDGVSSTHQTFRDSASYTHEKNGDFGTEEEKMRGMTE